MIYIISILIIVFFATIYSRIQIRRQILLNNIVIKYDAILLHVEKNSINVSNNLRTYLKGFKRFIINPEFADIQVLCGLLKSYTPQDFEKLKHNQKIIERDIAPEILEMGKGINKEISKLILFSMLKPDFILFVLWLLIKSLFTGILKALNNILTKGKFKFKTIIQTVHLVIITIDESRKFDNVLTANAY